MFDLLWDILCWIQSFGAAVVWAIMTALNLIIVGFAAVIEEGVSALPDMPEDVSWSGIISDVFGYANWAFPVSFIVQMVAILAGLYAVWLVISWILRLFRATQ